jgi:hypothetical protein
VGRYIDVEESYAPDEGTLRLYVVEEDGVVSGIYWDEDFAVQNAEWAADAGESERVVVSEVMFRRGESEVIHVAKDETAAGTTAPAANQRDESSSAALDTIGNSPRSEA